MRNIDCRHYSACLRSAALKDLRDLPCESCQFEKDDTYRMTPQDVHGLVKLWARAWGSTSDLCDLFQSEAQEDRRIGDFCQTKF